MTQDSEELVVTGLGIGSLLTDQTLAAVVLEDADHRLWLAVHTTRIEPGGVMAQFAPGDEFVVLANHRGGVMAQNVPTSIPGNGSAGRRPVITVVQQNVPAGQTAWVWSAFLLDVHIAHALREMTASPKTEATSVDATSVAPGSVDPASAVSSD